MDLKIDQTLTLDGDSWTVVGLGTIRDDGAQIVHLVSQTRFRRQRNGKNPIQALGWLTPAGDLEQASF